MIFDGPETQHGELFLHRRTFFFGRKKIPNSQKEISVVNSEFFSAKKKKELEFLESSPCWLPGPPKIIQIGPHPESRKNNEVGHSH